MRRWVVYVSRVDSPGIDYDHEVLGRYFTYRGAMRGALHAELWFPRYSGFRVFVRKESRRG